MALSKQQLPNLKLRHGMKNAYSIESIQLDVKVP